MAPKYTLNYFNSRGYAEVSRLILAESAVEYTDNRIDKEKEWPAKKSSTPFGKVPTLEVGGVVIAESRAIARFLAKEHGLDGKNNLEAAKCDMIVDACHDFLSNLRPAHLETDEQKKREHLAKFVAEILPPAFASLSKILEKNNGGKAFIVGNDLTWADLALAHILWGIHERQPAIINNYAVLKAFMERILNRPNVKAWLEKRPKTEF